MGHTYLLLFRVVVAVLLLSASVTGEDQPRCRVTAGHAAADDDNKAVVEISLSAVDSSSPVAVSSIRLAIGVASDKLQVTGIEAMPQGQAWEVTTFELRSLVHAGYDRLLILNASYSSDDSQTVLVDSLVLWQITLAVSESQSAGGIIAVPFMFADCGDNIVYTAGRDTALMARQVFDADSVDVTGFDESMPSLTGPAAGCFEQLVAGSSQPVPAVAFHAGAIAAAGSFGDIPGDIDLDGRACEETDLELFCRFFQYGDSVFTIDRERQIAATDVDVDGIDTTLTDLVALRYKLLGLSLPQPNPTGYYHGSFHYTLLAPGQLLISLRADVPVGGYNLRLSTVGGIVDSVVFVHDQNPGLFGQQRVESQGARLRILGLGGSPDNPWIDHWSTDLAIVYFEGMIPGQIIERLAAADLSPVMIGEFTDVRPKRPPLPGTAFLGANYPNPFNPNTRIDFYLPRTSSWSLGIYDIAGRLVRQYEGRNDRGWTSLEWDGRTSDGALAASGVYLYRLEAGDWSESRKMMLLK
jgi:hypothetical protein